MKKLFIAVYLIIIFCSILFVNCKNKNNPPYTPDAPSGQAYGLINVAYTFSSSATDVEENNIAIRFAWVDGDTSNWSDYVASGDTVRMSHSWSYADTYYIQTQAQDVYHNLSNWSDRKQVIISDNQPPRTPTIILGTHSGAVNVYYIFRTSTTDPDNDSVAYQFDWGNSVVSNWSNFAPSDSFVSMTNNWSGPGIFSIKARVKDTQGAISGWSYAYQIMITLEGSEFPNHIIKTITVGNQPANLTALSNDSFVYVINENSNNVSVIATSDNCIIATVNVGNQPAGVTALPNCQLVYVANQNSNNVSVIRTSDNTVVATIPVGQNPVGVTTLPNGNFVYVANSGSDDVSVIRTSDNALIATIPVGSNPWDITTLPNGNYVYVTNVSSSNISVVNTSNNLVVATIPLDNIPYRISSLPNGESLYVTNPYNNCITVIQTSNNLVVTTIPVSHNPYGIAILPDGDYMYVTHESSNNISVIRTADNIIAASIPVGQNPLGIASLSNSEYVYITNSMTNNVSVIGH